MLPHLPVLDYTALLQIDLKIGPSAADRRDVSFLYPVIRTEVCMYI